MSQINNQHKPKWYQTEGGIIALLILFFPVGLYLMWQYPEWSKKTKWIITSVLAVFCIVALVNNNDTSQQPKTNDSNNVINNPNINNTQQKTISEQPSNAVTINESAEPVQEVKKEEHVTIPGISAVDIYGNLKDLGFECTGPDVDDEKLVWWECKEEATDHNYMVSILGKSSTEILTIEASAVNYGTGDSNKVLGDFLSYMATVKYDNSEPEKTRNWVKENLNQNTDTVIGGVRLTITGNERSKTLIVAHENSDLD